jgi:transposase InsO family protein
VLCWPRSTGATRRIGERYGPPGVHATSCAEGHKARRGRFERLMRYRHPGTNPRRFRECTTDSNHDLPIAPNRLDRNFAVERPNQVWLAGISAPQLAAYDMRAGPFAAVSTNLKAEHFG